MLQLGTEVLQKHSCAVVPPFQVNACIYNQYETWILTVRSKGTSILYSAVDVFTLIHTLERIVFAVQIESDNLYKPQNCVVCCILQPRS